MRTDGQAAAPTLLQVRRAVVQDALNETFRGGRLKLADEAQPETFPVLRRELMYASLLAYEFADGNGPFAGDERLRDTATTALEAGSERFGCGGTVLTGGGPSPFFALVPFTRALLSLKDHVDGSWHGRMVDRAAELFAGAAARGDRTHDYCNARALETVSCLGLHRLTGDRPYLDRCVECLDELISRQYPCGAQPYHTGLWVWGRKPAQAYQFLSGSMMLHVGCELEREDAVEYVRRLMDYSLLATNRRGEAFVATFEGLHKARTLACAGRQWVIAAALGDERFGDLAGTTYRIWAAGMPGAHPAGKDGRFNGEALVEALQFGIREAPKGGEFKPRHGVRALPDISTVFVHEAGLDVSMNLLGGYSAFAEADCGDVKLFAVTPELTAEPTYRNAGIDALRVYWQKPSEQIECAADDGRSVLSGWVYTKWESGGKDFRYLHNRRLGVTMTYADDELVLEYETLKSWQAAPVPSRLLFLLIARPPPARPRLEIGGEVDVTPPAVESDELFQIDAPVGTVRFSAPDGSVIEVVPEVSTADRVTAERPAHAVTPVPVGNKALRRHDLLKPANEGSLRVAFEGPNALDRGRYRIHFRPAGR